MLRIGIGLLCVASATLMLELTLVRVFDVIWYSNMAYMVITLAMFCFGLSGVYYSLWPLARGKDPKTLLAGLSLGFAIAAMALLPVLVLVPFDFDALYTQPVKSSLLFLIIYFFLVGPFFLAGLIFTVVFSSYSEKIQSLYCWDLTGAAVGCVLLIPFLPPIGPGGLLFLTAGLGLVAAGCFLPGRLAPVIGLVLAGALITVPFLKDGYFDFEHHTSKRGVKEAQARNLIEDTRWDPISKIDVIDYGRQKHIAYDGGSQSSFIIPFDGDFVTLRENVRQRRGYHFYGENVYISHALKQDTGHEALIIGAAGGSETKAALMFGASHVDAVELVGYVIEIGKNKYAKYNGNIYNHPNVNAFTGEGRSFLRSTDRKYDVIQMYSNHTSSSIAAGSGAMATTYLQTAEAYIEYFSHLKDDGILHINHHVYPRMITTAALAWKQMGREDFFRHVIVLEAARHGFQDNLPTMLIKMEPWTEEECRTIQSYFPAVIQMVVHPLQPENNMLSPEFFSGEFSRETEELVGYRVGPATDNRPYFNFLRKSLHKLEDDPDRFMNYSTTSLLNSQLKNGWIPTDVVHLIVTGGSSLLLIIVFILIPMFFSQAGKAKWSGKFCTLIYFSCLGAGFIITELVFIQIFMKLIGFPLYTYSTILFTVLFAAGVGSAVSSQWLISPHKRWSIPFLGIFASCLVLLLVHQPYFEMFLQSPIMVRVLATMVLVFPVGFFLGMPFPLGILTIERQPQGVIAWAWAMNGLFTVIGGLASVLLSLFFGFKITLIVAMLIYLLAFVSYARLRIALA
jgi:spermidine synthase